MSEEVKPAVVSPFVKKALEDKTYLEEKPEPAMLGKMIITPKAN